MFSSLNSIHLSPVSTFSYTVCCFPFLYIFQVFFKSSFSFNRFICFISTAPLSRVFIIYVSFVVSKSSVAAPPFLIFLRRLYIFFSIFLFDFFLDFFFRFFLLYFFKERFFRERFFKERFFRERVFFFN